MRYLVVVMALLVSMGATAQGFDPDQYMSEEGAYWLYGQANQHQRYSALCGVYRQNADDSPIAVVRVDEYRADGTIVGTPIGNRTVINIETNDMDYVYGALAISRLCSEIPVTLAEKTAETLTEGADGASTIRTVIGIDEVNP